MFVCYMVAGNKYGRVTDCHRIRLMLLTRTTTTVTRSHLQAAETTVSHSKWSHSGYIHRQPSEMHTKTASLLHHWHSHCCCHCVHYVVALLLLPFSKPLCCHSLARPCTWCLSPLPQLILVKCCIEVRLILVEWWPRTQRRYCGTVPSLVSGLVNLPHVEFPLILESTT